jgi:hypothetical protein
MSWSLAITNGDLSFGSAGLNVVTGASKLTQDLACDILEPMGTDPLHPSFGSVIDGGVDTNGNYIQGVIGQINDSATGTAVGNEVSRICENYQTQQIARNQADVATYAKSTLTADEALLAVLNIQVEQIQDQALVTATLQTGAGGLPLTLPFSAS